MFWLEGVITPYSYEPFLLYILSCLYFLDCVYKHLWQYMVEGDLVQVKRTMQLVRVYCSGKLYHVNQEFKFLYRKKQICNELLHRAHLECSSQWQGMWQSVETAINMKFCNVNNILCDEWNKS